MITLAIDCMGGDFGPSVAIPASILSLKKHSSLSLLLFGEPQVINHELSKHMDDSIRERVTIVETTEVVAMDDKPSIALRRKKDSSMRRAIESVRDGQAQACVSAGNTGALMALARFVIKMIPGIDRPAIITSIPTETGHTLMLDLGANIDCDSETLFQFGIMGSVLSSAIDSIPKPRVGLLNIGEEEIKGNDQVKQASQLFYQCDHINYQGFIEANDIFSGKYDVVVTDGFTGNNVLKAGEGLVRMFALRLREAFEKSLFGKVAGLIVRPVLMAFKSKMDPDQYNGATLIGLRGIVIKSHGGASIKATVHAIEEAIAEVEKNVPERIAREVELLLSGRA